MSRQTVIDYFQSRFLGEARLIPPAPESIVTWSCPDVYAIAPHEEREHWVLFTVGASLFEQESRPRYFELMMSLPPTWQCDQTWPPRLLRKTAKTAGLWDGPVDGFVLIDRTYDVARPEHVFALLIAPSRQLEQSAQLIGACDEPAAVLATYPLTRAQFFEHRERTLDARSISEIIVEWKDMLIVG